MKRRTLKTLVLATLLAVGTSVTAEDQPVAPPQQDFTVKFEWDSRFYNNEIVGDAATIDILQKIISVTRDMRFETKLFGYVRLDDKQYIVFGKTDLKRASLLSAGSQRQKLIDQTGKYLYLINPSKNKILLSREITEYLGPALYGSDYGCMQDYIPIFRADINHDGHPEVFYFTSQPNGLTEAFVDSVDLHMLRGTDFKEVWNTRLVVDNYTTENTFKYTSGKYAALKLGPDFDTVKPYTPGIKQYTKLYFGYLNGDKKLDLLVWRRNYVALTVWKFDAEKFELYTMSPDVTFSKTDLTPEQGHMLLEKNALTWRDGFPNHNFCNSEGKPTDAPLIRDIDDPVLKH